MVVIDRRAPAIIVVKNILSDSPVAQLVHRGAPLHDPLQAAAWPILPSFQDAVWDTPSSIYCNGRFNIHPEAGGMGCEKGLPVSYGYCFLGAGKDVWLAPLRLSAGAEGGRGRGDIGEGDGEGESGDISGSGDEEVAISIAEMNETTDMVKGKTRDFLCHEIIPLSSNTLLLLNRDRFGTGLYQLTSHHNWSTDKAKAPEQKLIAGACWEAPHGMILSPSRKRLLVVETGQGAGNDGHSGGRISEVKLALHPTSAEVVVERVTVLRQRGANGAWNPLVDVEGGGEALVPPALHGYSSMFLASRSYSLCDWLTCCFCKSITASASSSPRVSQDRSENEEIQKDNRLLL
jgi:hypothetical protein